MKWFQISIFLILLIFTNKIFGANILFLFAGGNLSHKLSVWPFVKALGEAGHNVTFVSSSDKPMEAGPNVRDVTPLPFKLYTKETYMIDQFKNRLEGQVWDFSTVGYEDASVGFCEATMRAYQDDTEFRSIIDSDEYDLAIVNGIFGECALYLVYHMKLKLIMSSSTTVLPWLYGSFGIPIEASSVPELLQSGTHPLSYLDRVRNLYRYWVGHVRRSTHGQRLETLYRQTFKVNGHVPPIIELERRASLVFLNTHYSIDFARSLPPMYVSIGGMQCWDEIGTLPQKFAEFMDGAEEGVVLITFGSTIDLSTLDPYYVNIFFNTMRKFSQYRFIWRWNGPMPAGYPTNLMASKWLPQREILNHPKTRAFMTHGGLNGINEATFQGIPVIVLPLFADQDFNAYRIHAQELGVVVELLEFSQSVMDKAFKEILENKKYKQNMEVQSRMFKDRRMPPVQEAVFWTEFVLRQDNTNALKPMLLEQPWHVRHNVDIYFLIFSVVTLLPLLLIYIITKVF